MLSLCTSVLQYICCANFNKHHHTTSHCLHTYASLHTKAYMPSKYPMFGAEVFNFWHFFIQLLYSNVSEVGSRILKFPSAWLLTVASAPRGEWLSLKSRWLASTSPKIHPTHAAPRAGCSGKLREGNKTTKWQGHQDGTERCTFQLLLNCHHHSVVTHARDKLWRTHTPPAIPTSESGPLLAVTFFLSPRHTEEQRRPLRKQTDTHTRSWEGVLLLSSRAWRHRDWHETRRMNEKMRWQLREGKVCGVVSNSIKGEKTERGGRGWVSQSEKAGQFLTSFQGFWKVRLQVSWQGFICFEYDMDWCCPWLKSFMLLTLHVCTRWGHWPKNDNTCSCMMTCNHQNRMFFSLHVIVYRLPIIIVPVLCHGTIALLIC